MQQGAADL